MELELGATPKAAAKARRLVDGLADLPPNVREEAALLISEIVGNAVRHGSLDQASSIVVKFEVTESKLRMEVTNSGWEDVPHVKDPGPLETGGRGLFLVDRLADAWGVEVLDEERMLVWFELLL